MHKHAHAHTRNKHAIEEPNHELNINNDNKLTELCNHFEHYKEVSERRLPCLSRGGGLFGYGPLSWPPTIFSILLWAADYRGFKFYMSNVTNCCCNNRSLVLLESISKGLFNLFFMCQK
jgi:hypothetical protein